MKDAKKAVLQSRGLGTLRLAAVGVACGFLAALWAALSLMAWILIGDWLHGR